MVIQLRINELAKSRGIKNAYQLQHAVGLSPSNAVKLFSNSSALISLETLGKLCVALACEPNDLFAFSKDAAPNDVSKIRSR